MAAQLQISARPRLTPEDCADVIERSADVIAGEVLSLYRREAICRQGVAQADRIVDELMHVARELRRMRGDRI